MIFSKEMLGVCALSSPVTFEKPESIMSAILSGKEIGWKLRKLRLQAGWTQESLAEQIGVSVQQIQHYESGKNKMNTDRLQQMARALDVPVQAFFTEGDEIVPMAVAEKQLLSSFRDIPNREVQESILKITINAAKLAR